jgi:peptide/nickel transport system substrate-binding protein
MRKREHLLKRLRDILAMALFAVMIGGLASTGFSAGKSGAIVIAQSTDATSLDPAFRVDTATGNVQKHIFDSLLIREANMSVGLGLAESVERVSNTKWLVKVRKGVFFTNGEPLKAAAVKFSIDRILDPKLKAPSKRWWSNFTNVRVVDDYTVEITTKTRDPLFYARLTLLVVVPPKYVKEVGDTKFSLHPIGTGPYELVEWKKDDHITLKANKNYWSGVPSIEKVTFRVVPEELSRVAALQTGEADLIVGVSPAQAEHLRGVKGCRIEMSPTTRVMCLQFDADVPPGNQLKFRQAVACAINREEIIKGLLRGFVQPVTSVFSPGIPDWPQDMDTSFPYDPEKAKKLVSELNLGNTEILMRSPSARYPYDRETALAVGGQLKRAGLNIKVRPEEWGAFFADLKKGNMSAVYLMGQGNVWLDPYPQLEAFHHSKGFLSTWLDPEFDALLEASNTAEGDARTKIFGQALQRLHDQAGAVPLFAQVFIYGVKERLKWKPRIDNIIWALEMELTE